MAQALSIEMLEKEQFETMVLFRTKRQIAESLVKAGDLLLGKAYLREAFLLSQKATRIERQITSIKSFIN